MIQNFPLLQASSDSQSEIQKVKELILFRIEEISNLLNIPKQQIFDSLPHLLTLETYIIKPFSFDEGRMSLIIDHTLLKPTATEKEIEKVCLEGFDYNFFSICVNSSRVAFVKKFCENYSSQHNKPKPKIAAVVGFPLGACSDYTKYHETIEALSLGADEIDMVINIGKLKDKDYKYVFNEIKEIVTIVKRTNKLLKVILECGSLTEEEIITGCILSVLAGADFVKTSTGFGPSGATTHNVSLMKFVIGDQALVKASAGIRSADDLQRMVTAGAARIGTSSGVEIVSGSNVNKTVY